jgi:rhodanese-related sulfurtransferase
MAELVEITPVQLHARIARGDRPVVLDVREPGEIEIAAFPGAVHIPMNDIPSRIGELAPDDEIVVVCHHGMRSAHVAMYLASNGFSRVLNLIGGINAWSETVDPSVPRY